MNCWFSALCSELPLLHVSQITWYCLFIPHWILLIQQMCLMLQTPTKYLHATKTAYHSQIIAYIHKYTEKYITISKCWRFSMVSTLVWCWQTSQRGNLGFKPSTGLFCWNHERFYRQQSKYQLQLQFNNTIYRYQYIANLILIFICL